MPEQLWHIKRCPLFRHLAPAQLAQLEPHCRSRVFAAKTPIYLPADDSQSVFLLASGRAKICHLTHDGKQSILAFVEPAEIFGELALVAPGDRDEYAEAVEKSLVVRIPGARLQELMDQAPALTMGVSKLIGLRRKRIETRLKNLLFTSNRERLTLILLELAEQYGAACDEGVQLGIRLSHQDLASIIGSTRETVTVVLGEMQAEKLVAVGRRRITLLDLERLAAGVQRAAPALPPPDRPSMSYP